MISPHIRPSCMLRPSKRKAPLIAVLVVVVVAAAVIAAAGGVTHNAGNDAALLQLAAIAAVAIAPAIPAVPVSITVVAAVTTVVVAAPPVHSIRNGQRDKLSMNLFINTHRHAYCAFPDLCTSAHSVRHGCNLPCLR